MRFYPPVLFQRVAHYGGVRRVNIYALRLLYALMFFMLGQTTWAHILAHQGTWEPDNAMAWSVWAAFATLAGIGIFRPLQMLPILLLEIFYKGLWLGLVAYPLWVKGRVGWFVSRVPGVGICGGNRGRCGGSVGLRGDALYLPTEAEAAFHR